MRPDMIPGAILPDYELSDHTAKCRKLSELEQMKIIDPVTNAPRSWAERAYPKLMYYNKVEKGGHFAAWEQPELFLQEVRASFRSLRKVTKVA